MAKLKDPKKVFTLLTLSKRFMLQHTANFMENERLKDGYPRQDIPSNYPRITDKTLSRKINDTPKRVFQKVPDFTVDTGADKFTDICAEYLLQKEFIQGEDNGYSWYQKLINAGRDANAFGVCAVYSPFELVNGSYRIGFVPIYWGDLFLEAFTTSVNAANYAFVRQWKTEADLQEILDNEDDDIDDGWDRPALQKLLDDHATTPMDVTNTIERKTSSDAQLFEFYTYMSKDEFITFNIANGDTLLRTKDNKSRHQRIVGLYYDFNGLNPMGRSMVDIGGDLQNLIDSDMQAYQFNRALMLQPPIIINGDLDSGDGVYMPNNVLVSDDPSTAVKTIEVDTKAIQEYPNLYALQISQLNSLIPDATNTSTPSDAVGGLSGSKTSTGIKQNQQTESISDNFAFKNGEAFLSAWGENALNIYMGEFDGIIEIQLDNEYAAKARAEDPTRISPVGAVRLDCSQVTKIRVKVDTGSTKDVARDEDMQRLSGILNMEGQSPVVAGIIGEEGTKEVVKSMVKQSGISNAGDIIEAIDKNPPPAPQEQGPAPKPPKAPSETLNYKDAPPSVQRQIEEQAGLQPATETENAAQLASHTATAVSNVNAATAPPKVTTGK